MTWIVIDPAYNE